MDGVCPPIYDLTPSDNIAVKDNLFKAMSLGPYLMRPPNDYHALSLSQISSFE